MYTSLISDYDIKVNSENIFFDDEMECEMIPITDFKNEVINKINEEKLSLILKAMEIAKNYQKVVFILLPHLFLTLLVLL